MTKKTQLWIDGERVKIIPECPRCGSILISTKVRGYPRCENCGYIWKVE